MGTITIKNLSTLTDKTVVLIVANFWHNAVSMECLSEQLHIKITQDGNTFTVKDTEVST